jgi:hypothetical protein
VAADRGGWQAAWRRQSRRRRVGVLLVLALALLLGAGASWAATNPGLNSYRSVIGRVVDVDRGDPTTITVRFTAGGDEQVEASTDRLTWLPAEGGPVPIQYDPANPDQFVMQGYQSSSLLSTVLVGLFAVTLAAAWFSFRERPTT